MKRDIGLNLKANCALRVSGLEPPRRGGDDFRGLGPNGSVSGRQRSPITDSEGPGFKVFTFKLPLRLSEWRSLPGRARSTESFTPSLILARMCVTVGGVFWFKARNLHVA